MKLASAFYRTMMFALAVSLTGIFLSVGRADAMTVKVESNIAVGYDHTFARIWLNDTLIWSRAGFGGGGRGFVIAAIDTSTETVHGSVQHFDSWWSSWYESPRGANFAQMFAYLDSLPPGLLLVITVSDEAGLNSWGGTGCTWLSYAWVGETLTRFQSMGSTMIGSYCYNYSWAMMTFTGSGTALAEGVSTGRFEPISIESPLIVATEPQTWGRLKKLMR